MAAPLLPSKFKDKARRDKIIEDISTGLPYKFAAEGNQISVRSLYSWLEQGQEDLENNIDSDYVHFLHAIKAIEAKRISYHQNKVSKNIKNWQADAWMLERRWWKEFGNNAPLMELNGKLDKLLGEKDKGNG